MSQFESKVDISYSTYISRTDTRTIQLTIMNSFCDDQPFFTLRKYLSKNIKFVSSLSSFLWKSAMTNKYEMLQQQNESEENPKARHLSVTINWASKFSLHQ